MIMERDYTLITTREDVTDEIMEIVRGIESGWYSDARIDWEDVWDRMERTTLEDGTKIDMGTEGESPAMRKIKKIIRDERRYGG